jgi:hypothetical protein
MTCKECQQAMLLHDLLEANEREQMEHHKSQCVTCEKFWKETVQMNVALEKVAGQKTQATNPEALTDRIMTSVIRQRKPENVETWFDKLVFGSFTRLALSGISMVLVIFFITEFNTSLSEKPRGPVAGLQVILNSQDFRKNFTAPETEKRSLLSRCAISGNKVDLACLKSKMKF